MHPSVHPATPPPPALLAPARARGRRWTSRREVVATQRESKGRGFEANSSCLVSKTRSNVFLFLSVATKDLTCSTDYFASVLVVLDAFRVGCLLPVCTDACMHVCVFEVDLDRYANECM